MLHSLRFAPTGKHGVLVTLVKQGIACKTQLPPSVLGRLLSLSYRRYSGFLMAASGQQRTLARPFRFDFYVPTSQFLGRESLRYCSLIFQILY